MEDLKATLENGEINKEKIEIENRELIDKINRLVSDINESLRPVIDSKLEEISNLLEKRELWSALYTTDSKLKKYEDRIDELSSQEKTANKSKNSIKDIPDEKVEKLSEIVKKILTSWNFIEKNSVV